MTERDARGEQISSGPDPQLVPAGENNRGAELLILIVLLVTERRGKLFEGRTFWLYMLLYGVSRFVVEFYRGDDRGTVMGVSTSQFVSLLVVPLALVMLARLRGRARP